MTPGRARFLLSEFMTDIYPGKAGDWKIQYGDVLNELGNKLSKVLSKEKEVEEYLNNILEYMDDLNKFFTKQRKGRISYSRLFSFANSDKRISEFLFDKKLRGKLSKNLEIDMAGFDYEAKEEALDVIYEDEIYGYIYSVGNRKFFFSSVINRVVVQSPKGKIISYSLYRKRAKQEKGNYLKLSTIYKALLSQDRNGAMDSFQEYMKFLFIKNRAKKNGTRKAKKKDL